MVELKAGDKAPDFTAAASSLFNGASEMRLRLDEAVGNRAAFEDAAGARPQA
ncbi:MAG: hypothetical protein N2689_06285 [Verrucomicrobiae bacterium]|nr:hypothetical protein [Verrucomicrobiae bacterium]